jgi:hypothetical protein
MRGIRTLLKELNGLGESDTIRTFEGFMSECVRIMTALREGVKIDSIEFKRFHPTMRAGLAKALPDIERALEDSLREKHELPLEVTAQAILIYRDPDARALLTPTLKELVEQVLELERAGQLAVGAE